MSFPLHEAARDGKALIVKGLLKESPKDVQIKDDDGRVPLHWATSFQHTEIVSLLLHPWVQNGSGPFEIDIDELTDDAGWTPLHIASSVGSTEIIELLMATDPQPDVDLTTTTGLTNIHLATAKKHLAVVQLLVEKYNASVRIKDKKGQYPLHRAASVGSLPLVSFLAPKSNVNAKDNEGWTALHHALAEGFGDLAVALVHQYGADTSIENADGKKPIDVSVDLEVKRFFERETKQ